tara:strand:- start:121 stop:2451 length:2331 start_codon:yes stop_codon:yes gene_type:complete
MGANYTRQSTYADGDTINAADTNNEFDQLLAAFAASTGHTHDGTTGEGGPISALVSNAITFGTGADTDIAVTFDANSNDGVVTWKEDEDYFEFSDDILLATTEKVQFRDTAIHISSSTDGQLDIVADNEVQIAATTIDINGNVDISGTLTIGSAGISEAELEILDGATVTTTELNIIDGDTTASSTTVVDADRVVMNDDGTMKQVAVTDLAAYFDDEITAMPNLTSVGTLTTLTVDNIVINGTNIGHTSDTDAIAIASDGDVTFSQDVVITGDLTVSGDDITMGTNTAGNLLIADGTNFNSVAVGSLSEISTVANDDVFLAVDTSGGGLKKITRSAIVSGLATSGAISNVVEDSTPQLGGDLDMNGQDIVTTSNADIDLAPNGTGKVVVKGNTNPGTVVFNCESNSHGQTVKSQPHSASVTNVLTLPPGGDQEIVGTTATQTLTNKTLTTPVVNAGAQLKNGATSAGFLEFFEDSDNGTNKVTLIGPASTADVTVTLPSSAGTVALTSDVIGNVSEDSTPQLGGDLDVNGNSIVSASNGNISITPNGSGKVILDGLSHPTADGSAGQVLKTDGSGNLSFATVASDLSEDSSPQLGGNLDVNGNSITSASNGNVEIAPNGTGDVHLTTDTVRVGDLNTNAVITTNGTGDLTLSTNSGTNSGTILIADGSNADITIDPNGTGNILIGNFEFDADQSVGSGQDNYVLTYDNSTGHISLEAAAAAGATGGGGDEIFYENGQNVTTNYTITNGKNAMSAGPITIDSGVTVTVGSGETWTVV